MISIEENKKCNSSCIGRTTKTVHFGTNPGINLKSKYCKWCKHKKTSTHQEEECCFKLYTCDICCEPVRNHNMLSHLKSGCIERMKQCEWCHDFILDNYENHNEKCKNSESKHFRLSVKTIPHLEIKYGKERYFFNGILNSSPNYEYMKEVCNFLIRENSYSLSSEKIDKEKKEKKESKYHGTNVKYQLVLNNDHMKVIISLPFVVDEKEYIKVFRENTSICNDAIDIILSYFSIYYMHFEAKVSKRSLHMRFYTIDYKLYIKGTEDNLLAANYYKFNLIESEPFQIISQ